MNWKERCNQLEKFKNKNTFFFCVAQKTLVGGGHVIHPILGGSCKNSPIGAYLDEVILSVFRCDQHMHAVCTAPPGLGPNYH